MGPLDVLMKALAMCLTGPMTATSRPARPPSTAPRGRLLRYEFSSAEGRLDKVRFLKREHMFVEWTSWTAALREK